MPQSLPVTNLPTTTQMQSTHQVVSTFDPMQTHNWPLHTSQHLGQPYHTTISSYPPPPVIANFSSKPTSGGAIVYPEFVNHLVHPEVDSFKDIPKLPGQGYSPPSSAASLTFSTNASSCGHLPQEASHSPHSYSLLHSPLQSGSPVHLSEEDLQQILELNKDNMYT